jgi:putative nucleotidyltransferase with HDIG domain
LGDRDAAAASVRDVEGGGSTRIQAMRAVLVALLAAPNEFDPDVDDIITALTGLRAAGFGGMAKLIEALPYRGGPSAAAQKSMGQVLAERELPDRFADAVKADDTQSLYDWLEARSNALPSEAEIARAFATWSAAQQVAESGSRATIEAVRQGLATYRRRSPIEIGPFDEIDLSIAALFEHLDNAAPLMAEHSRAVSAWCSRLARALDLPEQDVDFVTRGGLIHDIGKMKTPATILNAPRKLTPEEWAVMQSHVVEGAQIIAGVPILQPFAPIVRGHHERLDGKGYPDGLRGSAIPLAARIVAVADSFNAMIGRRAYRRAMSPIEALDELERSAGTQLDPEVVAAMVRIVLGRIAHKNPPG